MLLRGPYPESLKRRVAGGLGHLSNAQAAELLAAIDCSRLQHLVLTHLSETNNTPARALAAAVGVLGHAPDWLTCAHQDDGLDWRTVQ
jgi:phosphoribosyl 1,2-cyclic phosphodiesterase